MTPFLCAPGACPPKEQGVLQRGVLRKAPAQQSAMRILLLALLAAVLAGLCACTAPAEAPEHTTTGAQAPATNPGSHETDEQGKAAPSGEGEHSELLDIPPENLILPADLKTLIQAESCVVFDARTYLEYTEASIPGALNLPFRFVERRQAEIPRDSMVVFLATDERELLELYDLLLSLGFDPANIKMLKGGIDAWLASGFAVEEYEIKAC